MLLNVAPPHNSSLPDEAIKLYEELGHFVKSCYGEGETASSRALNMTRCFVEESCERVTLTLPNGRRSFDRVLMKEELSRGQLVNAFEILADGVRIFNGTSIGRSLIVLLDRNVTASEVQIHVLSSKSPPSFRLIAVPDPAACVAGGSGGEGCKIRSNVIIGGFPSSIPSRNVSHVDECCAACVANAQTCVAFTAVPTSSAYTCTLLRATGGADRMVRGAYSGSPK